METDPAAIEAEAVRKRTRGAPVDLKAQAPLTRDIDPLGDLSHAPNDADDRSDVGRPTTDHDPKGWLADPASKP